MTQQNFSLYTSNGYAGDLVDSGPRVVQTGVLVGSGAGFGVALKREASVERGVALGGPASTGKTFALSQREYNHEAGSRPTDGTDFAYLETESVSIIRQGYLYVQIVDAVVTAGAALFVHPTTGELSGTATGGYVVSTNIFAEEVGVAGDVIKARIDI
jgi:hypothetical protein